MRPFVLRRTKEEVFSDIMLQKDEYIIRTYMAPYQRAIYREVLAMLKGIIKLPRKDMDKENGHQWKLMAHLRQLLQHPCLTHEVCLPIGTKDPVIVRGSGKMELIDRMVPKLLLTGHKIL